MLKCCHNLCWTRLIVLLPIGRPCQYTINWTVYSTTLTSHHNPNSPNPQHPVHFNNALSVVYQTYISIYCHLCLLSAQFLSIFIVMPHNSALCCHFFSFLRKWMNEWMKYLLCSYDYFTRFIEIIEMHRDVHILCIAIHRLYIPIGGLNVNGSLGYQLQQRSYF